MKTFSALEAEVGAIELEGQTIDDFRGRLRGILLLPGNPG